MLEGVCDWSAPSLESPLLSGSNLLLGQGLNEMIEVVLDKGFAWCVQRKNP